MGAVDGGVVGQRRKPLQAGPHLLGGAFEEAAATQGEQGVAHEGDPVGRVEIGDVPERMAAGLDHLEPRLAQHHHVAAAHLAVDRREAGDLGRPHHGRAGGGHDLGVAAGVVGVPVRVEDEVERPAVGLQGREDGPNLRRVDAGRPAGRLVVGEEAVVVRKAGELVDGERHGRLPGAVADPRHAI